MFELIVRAVLAHKQVVIAAVAFAGLVGYISPLPNAIAQNFFGPPVNLSVNTRNAYVSVFDQTLSVQTPGASLELHFAGF
jgi:hypothetical protein